MRDRALRGGVLALTAGACLAACGPDAEFRPDQRLQDELGLSPRTEVHRVAITGGAVEQIAPREVSVPVDAFVEFVTMDSWVHEVRFELDSLEGPNRDFIERTDQGASPPMVNADSRFVVSLQDAPPGRYPFLVEGNGAPARGAVVVSF